jgi:diguanylate cyclase (GGDEF)-like protein/putative nucleotidyltransferase with HDIG domain
MKELSFSTKMYLCLTYAVGLTIFIWHIDGLDISKPWMLTVLCLLASLALIFKVEGPTNRSHYTFSFLVYGFTFTLYGIPEATLVIVVSNLAEWIWNRPPWYIQLFNACCYIVVAQAAGLVYYWINPGNVLVSGRAVLAIAISMFVYDLLNHLMVGIVVWLARGENFKRSGVFDFFPLILDLTLLYFGASLSFVWIYNNFALVLFLIPIYMIYSTLRVPALERKTEIDIKTGLFNHEYFKQQVASELSRANRFERPLAIIMADLDLLRNINNTYGHLAGDEVLIGVARTLKKSVREYDVAARFGGEEFAILLPETTIEQAYERAESIRKSIEEMEFTIPTSISPIRVTMSFGVACRENFGQLTDEIIHNADTALYHSKLSGRNRAYAHTHDGYINYQNDSTHDPVMEPSQPIGHPGDESSRPPGPTTSAESRHEQPPIKDRAKIESSPLEQPAASSGSKTIVNLYIGLIALIALTAFVAVCRVTPSIMYFPSASEWGALFVIAILIASSEWFSVNLYFNQTAVSTSAILILAGYLLFGPVGIFGVSLVVAITLFVKYRSPISRFFFNFSNHILAGTFCFAFLLLTGKPYWEWGAAIQILLILASAVVMYFVTTWSIAIGMGLDIKQPARQIWKEQYSWLAPYYIGFGLIAYALIFGYLHGGIVGILVMIIPIVLLRFSQKQYISRTREAVIELREKNLILKKSSEEIATLNEGLFDILSEIIALRDPYVLGHSKQVSCLATEIAKSMKLNDGQIELIRKGALLHDIGKLGISEEILRKPARLTVQEYEVMKRHTTIGASLVEKSPALRPLVPIILHHHEFFNGKGYPDKLKGQQIPIEARIVALADAIEAMSSQRPYRKAFDRPAVIQEMKRCAGSQFDPLIVEAALATMETEAELKKPDPEASPDILPRFVPSS